MKVPKINIKNMPGAGFIKKIPADKIKYEYKTNPEMLHQIDNDIFMKKNLKAPVSGDSFVSKIKNGAYALIHRRKREKLRKAIDLFREYQYSSDFINMTLRDSKADKIFMPKGDASDWMQQNYIRMKAFVKNGFNTLAKPLDRDTTVYRLVFNENVEGGYKASWKIGDIVREKGFTSTSKEPDNPIFRHLKVYFLEKAEDCENFSPVNLKIKLPKGTKVVSDDTLMKEVLVKNNSLFKVTDFDEATNTYTWQYLKSEPVKFISK